MAEALVKVKTIFAIRHDADYIEPGSTVKAPKSVVDQWLAAGAAQLVAVDPEPASQPK